MVWNIRRAKRSVAQEDSWRGKKKSKLDMPMNKHTSRNPDNRSQPTRKAHVRGKGKFMKEGRFVVPSALSKKMPRGCPEEHAERSECGLGHRFPDVPIKLFFDERNLQALTALIQHHISDTNPSVTLKFEARMAIQEWLVERLVEEEEACKRQLEEERERRMNERRKQARAVMYAFNHRCKSCTSPCTMADDSVARGKRAPNSTANCE